MDSEVLRIIGLLLAVAGPGSSLAEDEQRLLETCTVIADDVKRLACFDAYAAAVRGEGPGGSAVSPAASASITDPAQDGPSGKATNPAGPAPVAAAAETQDDTVLADESFGLPATRDEPEEREAERVEAHVAEFMRLNRSNNIRITLDNGQVWQEIDGRSFKGTVKPGTLVTVTRRPFGGYKMSVEGRSSSIYVRRIK